MHVKFDEQNLTLRASAATNLAKFVERVAIDMSRQYPDDADCWVWGRAYVGDLSSTKGVSFFWGGAEDRPDDGKGQFACLVDTALQRPTEEL